jgi:hypothetical protein
MGDAVVAFGGQFSPSLLQGAVIAVTGKRHQGKRENCQNNYLPCKIGLELKSALKKRVFIGQS